MLGNRFKTFIKRRRRKADALASLLQIYKQRPDLQQVYPEVKSGKYEDLLGWAASASIGEFKDSSRPMLAPFADWYIAHKPTVAPIPWQEIEKTSAASAFPSPLTLEVMQDREANAISHHLPTLFFLVVEFGLKNIVELGTHTGNSAITLLEAAQHVGGRVLSIDVQPCLVAKDRVQKANLSHLWTFIQANDLQLEADRIFQSIDLLFIDTDHQYHTTIQELRKYGCQVRNGSWIVLHDYASFAGVTRAVEEFVRMFPAKPHFHPFIHQNGLAVLRVQQTT